MPLFMYHVFICSYSVLNTLLKCHHLRSFHKGTSATLFPTSFFFITFITSKSLLLVSFLSLLLEYRLCEGKDFILVPVLPQVPGL